VLQPATPPQRQRAHELRPPHWLAVLHTASVCCIAARLHPVRCTNNQEQALIPYDVTLGASWLSAIGFNPTWQALLAQVAIVSLPG
jgi:hypothetical protein